MRAAPSSTRCDRVGIDLVLRRQGGGGHRLDRRAHGCACGRRACTPGCRATTGSPTWTTSASTAREALSGFPGNARRRASWAGYPGVYVPVKLEVAYADGERVTGIPSARLPQPGVGMTAAAVEPRCRWSSPRPSRPCCSARAPPGPPAPALATHLRQRSPLLRGQPADRLAPLRRPARPPAQPARDRSRVGTFRHAPPAAAATAAASRSPRSAACARRRAGHDPGVRR